MWVVKDWVRVDVICGELEAEGILVMDTLVGVEWCI